MKGSRIREEQIIGISREAEAGLMTAEVCRRHGIDEATLHKWKAEYSGTEVADAKRLRGLEDENRRLKKPGQTSAIFSAGGLGLCAVQLAKVFGSTQVIAVDLLDHKLAMAKELGADEVINAQVTDPIARLRSLTNGGVDVAFVLVGSEQAMQHALASVGFIGRVVLRWPWSASTYDRSFLDFIQENDHHGSYGLSVD